MSNYVDSLKKRRSIYALGKNSSSSEQELVELIQAAVKETPSAFNSQSSRVVILFGDANARLWDITKGALEPLTPAENFPATVEKLNSFAAGIGTILFFEDTTTVRNLQENFPLYADNFPVWSEQSHGMTAHSVWTALANIGLGANLQHYNPVIDEAVVQEWGLNANWKLRAQMPFGSIEVPAGEKEYMNDSERFFIFH